MTIETIKVKPWGKNQGDFVLINAGDFDSSKHEKYEDQKKPSVVKKPETSNSKDKE